MDQYVSQLSKVQRFCQLERRVRFRTSRSPGIQIPLQTTRDNVDGRIHNGQVNWDDTFHSIARPLQVKNMGCAVQNRTPAYEKSLLFVTASTKNL